MSHPELGYKETESPNDLSGKAVLGPEWLPEEADRQICSSFAFLAVRFGGNCITILIDEALFLHV